MIGYSQGVVFCLYNIDSLRFVFDLDEKRWRIWAVKEKKLFSYNFFSNNPFFVVVFVVVFIVQYNCIIIYTHYYLYAKHKIRVQTLKNEKYWCTLGAI